MYKPVFMPVLAAWALQAFRGFGNIGELRIDLDRFQQLNFLEQRLRGGRARIEEFAEPLARRGQRAAIRRLIVARDGAARREQQ
jgi:hypothetical protein